MAEVVVYMLPGHHRSEAVCRAMAEGIRRAGDPCLLTTIARYQPLGHRVAVFYGLQAQLERVMRDFSTSPDHTAVYIDLGYWGRKAGGRFAGYHKLSIDGRHPTAYFQARPHDDSRIRPFGLQMKPWRAGGRHILLAGMGPKGAKAEGYAPLGWERWAVQQIRAVSDRPIIYRPKPTFPQAKVLPGARLSSAKQPLAPMLAGCWAVVTHHSNVGVDALVEGVPIYTEDGAARPFSMESMAAIERPAMPEGREQFMAGLAYWQWSLAEMQRGECWDHIRKEAFGGATL